MHEISNDGARDQFEALLATVIVPAMIKCARVCLYTHWLVPFLQCYYRKERGNVTW